MSNLGDILQEEVLGEIRAILAEAESCHKTHPKHHVRLVGYDNYKQSQGAAMVIYRGPMKG